MKIGDNISSMAQPALPGLPWVYNGTDLDLLVGLSDQADAVATASKGLPRTWAELAAFNGTSFDRLRSAGDNADALVTSAVGILRLAAEAFEFNGVSFDR